MRSDSTASSASASLLAHLLRYANFDRHLISSAPRRDPERMIGCADASIRIYHVDRRLPTALIYLQYGP